MNVQCLSIVITAESERERDNMKPKTNKQLPTSIKVKGAAGGTLLFDVIRYVFSSYACVYAMFSALSSLLLERCLRGSHNAQTKQIVRAHRTARIIMLLSVCMLIECEMIIIMI